MKKCRKCGYELEKGARKCIRCGHEFKVRHCRICGCKLETDHEFDARLCNRCGKNISKLGCNDSCYNKPAKHGVFKNTRRRGNDKVHHKHMNRDEKNARWWRGYAIWLFILLVWNIAFLLFVVAYFVLDVTGIV